MQLLIQMAAKRHLGLQTDNGLLKRFTFMFNVHLMAMKKETTAWHAMCVACLYVFGFIWSLLLWSNHRTSAAPLARLSFRRTFISRSDPFCAPISDVRHPRFVVLNHVVRDSPAPRVSNSIWKRRCDHYLPPAWIKTLQHSASRPV